MHRREFLKRSAGAFGLLSTFPAHLAGIERDVRSGTLERRSFGKTGEIVYLGTTDTTYEPGHEVWPEIALEDVEYLLQPPARYLDWLSAEDPDGELYIALGGIAMPFTVYISADGEVVKKHNGPLTADQLRSTPVSASSSSARARSSWMFMPMKVTSSPSSSSTGRNAADISATHEGHHDAQKLSTMGFP